MSLLEIGELLFCKRKKHYDVVDILTSCVSICYIIRPDNESINSYQDKADYILPKKATCGLDIDSKVCPSNHEKASPSKLFSDKVSFLKNKVTPFIEERTMSLLSGATDQNYLDLLQQQDDLDDDSLRVKQPVEGAFESGFQVGFKGYDQLPHDSVISKKVNTEDQQGQNPIDHLSKDEQVVFEVPGASNFIRYHQHTVPHGKVSRYSCSE